MVASDAQRSIDLQRHFQQQAAFIAELRARNDFLRRELSQAYRERDARFRDSYEELARHFQYDNARYEAEIRRVRGDRIIRPARAGYAAHHVNSARHDEKHSVAGTGTARQRFGVRVLTRTPVAPVGVPVSETVTVSTEPSLPTVDVVADGAPGLDPVKKRRRPRRRKPRIRVVIDEPIPKSSAKTDATAAVAADPVVNVVPTEALNTDNNLVDAQTQRS